MKSLNYLLKSFSKKERASGGRGQTRQAIYSVPWSSKLIRYSPRCLEEGEGRNTRNQQKRKDWTCSGWASAQSWAAEHRAGCLQRLFLESAHSTCSKLEMASGFAQILLHAASDYSYPISVAFSQSSVCKSFCPRPAGAVGRAESGTASHSSSKPVQSLLSAAALYRKSRGPRWSQWGAATQPPPCPSGLGSLRGWQSLCRSCLWPLLSLFSLALPLLILQL